MLRTDGRPGIRWDDFGAGDLSPPPLVPALGGPARLLAAVALLVAAFGVRRRLVGRRKLAWQVLAHDQPEVPGFLPVRRGPIQESYDPQG